MSGDRKTEDYNRLTFTQAELEEIRDAFHLFDTKGTGIIDPAELDSVVRSLGLEHNATVEDFLACLKQSKKGQGINVNDFINLVRKHRVMKGMVGSPVMGDNDGELRRIFDLFDKEHKGYITVDNLKSIARELGETMTGDELQEMILRANLSQDGKVKPDEFYAIMTKQLFS